MKLAFSLFLSCILLQTYAQQTIGLFENDSTSYQAYTLFSPSSAKATYLIDNCGEQVNSWTHQEQPGNSAYLLPDGDLLRSGRRSSNVFSGGGIGGYVERQDWNGNLEWSIELADSNIHQHHDIYPMPNGNVLCLLWERKTRAEAIAAGRDTNLLDTEIWIETLVEVKPLGIDSAEIVWTWSAWDHLIQNFDSSKANFGNPKDHPRRIDFNYLYLGQSGLNKDWLHANGLSYNEDLDQIGISIRSFSEIWLIDHSTTSAEAKGSTGGIYGKGGDLLFRYGNIETYGRGDFTNREFFFMHHINWIPKGHPNEGLLTTFNNKPGTDTSEVWIYEPEQTSPGHYVIGPDSTFKLTGTPTVFRRKEIYSPITSSFQVLPNGNYFMCAGQKGRFYEFNDTAVVWEYQNPVNHTGALSQGDNPTVTGCFRATRYGRNYSAFVGRNLLAQGPIEMNPLPSNCVAGDGLSVESEQIIKFENPVRDVLSFQLDGLEFSQYQIFDLNGQLLLSGWLKNQNQIDVSSFPSGMFFLQIFGNENTTVHKLIKL